MKKPRFWFSDERNELVLDTPVGLNALQMRNACDFVKKVYMQKFESYPPGDRRDTVKKGLEALQDGRVAQRVVGRNDYEIDRIMIGAR
jgi:hypothetical protein